MLTNTLNPASVAEDFMPITLELVATACRLPIAAVVLENKVILFNQASALESGELEAWLSHFHKSCAVENNTEIHDLWKVPFAPYAGANGQTTALRFYAGRPLVNSEGSYFGYLCLLDTRPNSLTRNQQQVMDAVTRQIVQLYGEAPALSTQPGQLYHARQTETRMRKIAFDLSHDLRQQVAIILGLLEIFRLNNYHTDTEDMKILESCANKLDVKIRSIVCLASNR